MDRFINNGDGTVTDSVTGLIWQQEDDGIERTWYKANEYAKSLNLGGKTDWRLPTVQELGTIVDYGRYNPAIDPIFSNVKPSVYCSGTTDARHTRDAWIVDFFCGYVSYDSKFLNYYVRCVRGGK